MVCSKKKMLTIPNTQDMEKWGLYIIATTLLDVQTKGKHENPITLCRKIKTKLCVAYITQKTVEVILTEASHFY